MCLYVLVTHVVFVTLTWQIIQVYIHSYAFEAAVNPIFYIFRFEPRLTVFYINS